VVGSGTVTVIDPAELRLDMNDTVICFMDPEIEKNIDQYQVQVR